MGLIDILTQYDTKKKAAHAMKTAKHGVRFLNWTAKRTKTQSNNIKNLRNSAIFLMELVD